MNTIAQSAAAKDSLLRGNRAVPSKRRAAAQTKAPSTLRLLAYMAITGIAAGGVLYVAAVIGISRVQPEPTHNAAPAHHHAQGTV